MTISDNHYCWATLNNLGVILIFIANANYIHNVFESTYSGIIGYALRSASIINFIVGT